jgi:hypothetical protein
MWAMDPKCVLKRRRVCIVFKSHTSLERWLSFNIVAEPSYFSVCAGIAEYWLVIQRARVIGDRCMATLFFDFRF